jgi:hypothetical protein
MIQLSDLRPHPLISLGLNPASDIFGGTCKFEEGKHYLVQAPSGRGSRLFCIVCMVCGPTTRARFY